MFSLIHINSNILPLGWATRLENKSATKFQWHVVRCTRDGLSFIESICLFDLYFMKI